MQMVKHKIFGIGEVIGREVKENGNLVFEDQSLTEPFKAAYNAYCHTEDARMENYGYYM